MAEAVNLVKAKIGPVNKGKGPDEFSVLFNPTQYSIEKSVQYASHSVMGLDSPIVQFISGSSDSLTMELFFDTYSAGAEAGDSNTSKTFESKSKEAESAKEDVRKYTNKVFNLMDVYGDTHAPPFVYFKWGSLMFKGYVSSVSQTFTKFTFKGTPVRARLNVTFTSSLGSNVQLRQEPRNSPDRTKYRSITEGMTITALAEEEYADAELWREIAEANRIENPRLMRSGMTVKIPALRSEE